MGIVRFDVFSRFIPVHTGNINAATPVDLPHPVYPCAYREHILNIARCIRSCGLSLCIQGTLADTEIRTKVTRFIPVHTGNIRPLTEY